MANLLNPIPVVMERTGIGRSKLYELMSAGQIESVKIGTRRLIPEVALEEFVARLRAEQSGRRLAGIPACRSAEMMRARARSADAR
jgi:excisionase family DNA binding protein